MIARADVRLDTAGDSHPREWLGGENIVESPPNVALAHVPPRSPPAEHAIVVRVEFSTEVYQTAAQESLEEGAFLGKLANRAGFRSFGWTSISARAIFKSPQSSSCAPVAWNASAYDSNSCRKRSFAG